MHITEEIHEDFDEGGYVLVHRTTFQEILKTLHSVDKHLYANRVIDAHNAANIAMRKIEHIMAHDPRLVI